MNTHNIMGYNRITMKCHLCKHKNATTALTAIVNGQRSMVNVCTQCRNEFDGDAIVVTTAPTRIKLTVETFVNGSWVSDCR